MARDRGGTSTSAVEETAEETGEARRRRLRDEDMLVARGEGDSGEDKGVGRAGEREDAR